MRQNQQVNLPQENVEEEKPAVKRLRLIFGEDHSDLTTEKVLTLLVPRLKAMGVETYFDEIGQNLPPEMYLQLLRKMQENRRLLIALAKGHIEPAHLDDKFLNWASSIKQDRAGFLRLIQGGAKLTQEIDLFQACSEHGITRKHIDFDHASFVQHANGDIEARLSGNESKQDQTRALERSAERDEMFVKAYASEQSSVFGRVGLGHVQGMQEKILKMENPLQDHYVFFHLHQGSTKSYSNAFRKEHTYPMGLEVINVEGLTDERVVETVVSRVNQLTQQMSEIKPIESADSINNNSRELVEKFFLFYTPGCRSGWRVNANEEPTFKSIIHYAKHGRGFFYSGRRTRETLCETFGVNLEDDSIEIAAAKVASYN